MVYVNETQLKLNIQGIKEAKHARFRPMVFFKMQTQTHTLTLTHTHKIVRHWNHCCCSRNHCRHVCILLNCFYREKRKGCWKLKLQCALHSKVTEHFISLATGLKTVPPVSLTILRYLLISLKLRKVGQYVYWRSVLMYSFEVPVLFYSFSIYFSDYDFNSIILWNFTINPVISS